MYARHEPINGIQLVMDVELWKNDKLRLKLQSPIITDPGLYLHYLTHTTVKHVAISVASNHAKVYSEKCIGL